MVTDVAAPIYVWCIAGDISTFPVGDATATMTPDGNAVWSHFLIADIALFFFVPTACVIVGVASPAQGLQMKP